MGLVPGQDLLWAWCDPRCGCPHMWQGLPRGCVVAWAALVSVPHAAALFRHPHASTCICMHHVQTCGRWWGSARPLLCQPGAPIETGRWVVFRIPGRCQGYPSSPCSLPSEACVLHPSPRPALRLGVSETVLVVVSMRGRAPWVAGTTVPPPPLLHRPSNAVGFRGGGHGHEQLHQCFLFETAEQDSPHAFIGKNLRKGMMEAREI